MVNASQKEEPSVVQVVTFSTLLSFSHNSSFSKLYLPNVIDNILDVGFVLIGELCSHDGDLDDIILPLDQGHLVTVAPTTLNIDALLHGLAAGDADQMLLQIIAGIDGGGRRLQLRPPVDHPDNRLEISCFPKWYHQLTCTGIHPYVLSLTH